ncbi:UDP-glucose dehydrogenase family protein [Pedomonas mirosovicensis]|uniref:UDP-glucose dehydrogenase family protein n=1 Tax=Pedomonas mirosovicensis TaxID=2908641 RepID=UPI002169BE6C|nr:UDP-glucose/GDP-mannose dehydrogenase family protein [Pedomonas mirosovicensis]MCH8685166.1 UDP-glucose/GDP-mannose dehydrogenase family protein [Pedomonas mirosovicensis]
MRIAVVGTGYVGLVSGACMAEFGHQVTCVDTNPDIVARLSRGEPTIYEPGLDDLLQRNIKANRLTFTTELAAAVPEAQAVFIAVGTPSRRGDGHADLTYVFAAAKDIATHARNGAVIITKSTVPVGTASRLRELVAEVAPLKKLEVASNPEFLREGSAIQDFMHPDRVVVGTTSEEARQVLKEIYRPLYLRETPILFASCETAEVIKYAANAFLATKISFINEVADLCEKVGADVQDVAKGIGLDKRIGDKFLHPGPGYGGSCFPKDTLALLRTAEEAGVPLRLVSATVEVNTNRKQNMAQRIVAACGGAVDGKTIAVLGLTFKPNTDDMRDSPALDIVPALQKAGAHVRAYDPVGMEHAAPLLPNVDFADDPYSAMKDASAVVIITEWNEFRALDLTHVKRQLKEPVFVDLRNIYRTADMAAAGFRYVSIGRPQLEPAAVEDERTPATVVPLKPVAGA